MFDETASGSVVVGKEGNFYLSTNRARAKFQYNKQLKLLDFSPSKARFAKLGNVVFCLKPFILARQMARQLKYRTFGLFPKT